MSLIEHLEDLRKRIFRCLLILAITWTFAWFNFKKIYDTINATAMASLPKELKYAEVLHSITDAFMLQLKVSFYVGLVIALPFMVVQVWGFVAPGLKPRERKPFKIVGPLSVVLFALGCWFCWQIIPSAMQWFAGIALESFRDTQINQEAGRLVFFIINMMLAFGLGFQLPLIVYFLARVGILPMATIHQYWRHAIVGIFFAAGALTPSNDPFSMMMLAVPLCILFALSVLAVKWTTKPLPDDYVEPVGEPIEDPKPAPEAVPFSSD
ncbi:MAG: twin-arginine translocase subunit TatC [Chthonomonas sp.]|nr:twin-arginine translocase subunit TatC [Chthonomonas sp.]